MRRICLDEVCRQVSNRQAGAIDYAMKNGMEEFPYPFTEFYRDVLADDFISSRVTARVKWNALIATGVVEERADKTFLRVKELRQKSQSVKFRREVYR